MSLEQQGIEERVRDVILGSKIKRVEVLILPVNSHLQDS